MIIESGGLRSEVHNVLNWISICWKGGGMHLKAFTYLPLPHKERRRGCVAQVGILTLGGANSDIFVIDLWCDERRGSLVARRRGVAMAI